MMGKITAYIFIFLANFVLLAHAVLPHHHNPVQQDCSDCTHCVIDELAQINNTSKQDHSHNENTNLTSCILKQAVIIPSLQNRILKYNDNCLDFHKHNFYWLAIIENNDSQPVSDNQITTQEFFPFLLFSRATTSSGLRAPPVV